MGTGQRADPGPPRPGTRSRAPGRRHRAAQPGLAQPVRRPAGGGCTRPSNVPSIAVARPRSAARRPRRSGTSGRRRRSPVSVGMKKAKICKRSGGRLGEAAGSRPRYWSWRPRHSSVTWLVQQRAGARRNCRATPRSRRSISPTQNVSLPCGASQLDGGPGVGGGVDDGDVDGTPALPDLRRGLAARPGRPCRRDRTPAALRRRRCGRWSSQRPSGQPRPPRPPRPGLGPRHSPSSGPRKTPTDAHRDESSGRCRRPASAEPGRDHPAHPPHHPPRDEAGRRDQRLVLHAGHRQGPAPSRVPQAPRRRRRRPTARPCAG